MRETPRGFPMLLVLLLALLIARFQENHINIFSVTNNNEVLFHQRKRRGKRTVIAVQENNMRGM
jgi:hypothetical protein